MVVNIILYIINILSQVSILKYAYFISTSILRHFQKDRILSETE